MTSKLTVAVPLMVFAIAASAQEPPLPLRMSTTLELRASAQHVTGDFGDWRELSLLGTHVSGPHVLQAELSTKQRFGDRGVWAGIADTYTIDPDWYASVGVGGSEGAFFLPRVRVDAMLYRKLGEERRTVLFVGPGYARQPDGHTDRMWTAGLIYYFASPWVVQAGVRHNQSDPGNVRTRQQFAAVSYGREGADLVALRASGGREGYSLIGPDTAIVVFASREASLQWRHWFDRSSGITIGLEHYRNPYYERSGAAIGWFGTWQ
jgi:YaiO family outer membrane protein